MHPSDGFILKVASISYLIGLMSKGSKDIQLTQTLLNKRGPSNPTTSGKPKIDNDWLKNLFDNDNMKDKISNKELQKVGGYEGLTAELKTDLKNGIINSAEDKKERIRKFGRNDPVTKISKTLWDMVMQNFEDKTIQILCFAAIASLVLGIASHGIQEGWLEGVSIILAVLIITIVTSGNNYMKEKQFRKLNEVASRKNVNVVRAGQVVNMSVFELMVGDIVQIETGEIISVDGLVVRANRLSLDESAMTGETHALKKEPFEFNSNRNCFLTSGTMVVEGTGHMMVLAVGKNTVENQLKAKLQQDDELTPLQEKLADLADQIGKLGMYSAAFTFAALLLHLLFDCFLGRRQLFSIEFLNGLVEYFIIAVSIIVLAVPEGLPLAVTISLAYSVGKMREENNLVRFLAACETMGGANNICSDKTGTLTKNMMTVTRFWAQNRLIESFDKTDRSFSESFKELLSIGIALNSDAQPKVTKAGVFAQIGNKTECALIEMSYKLGFDFRDIRKSEQIISTVPFSSERKRMSVICKLAKRNKYYIFSKGAPEILIGYCSKYIDKNNEVATIDETYRHQLQETISQFASSSLRTILVCYQELSKDIVNTPDPEKLERDLIVLGLTGIKDPLKESVPEAVLNCKKAGIIVRMVTGDNTETAVAIAKDAHIIPSDYTRPTKGEPGYFIAMEGKEFRTLVEGLVTEEDGREKVRNIDIFRQITDELRVLARSSPDDKYLLATGLKQLDNVVAMTGDGTNDAPALKKADIGFAMGIAGTEVAKDASGIILLDDNFSSIITAVKYGRNIFDCIRKFLQFQLTVNVVAIFMAFLGAVIIKESPLTPVQMLWVNLIMDTLAALALATEPPSNDLLNRMPYSRSEHIITSQMWRNIVLNAIYQIIVLTYILFKGDELFGVSNSIGLEMDQWNDESGKHLSIFFNIFVYLQVFNFFNARKLKKDELNVFENFFDNYLFLAIVAAIFVCQLFIIQVGGRAFMLVPLSMRQHLDCIFIGATMLLASVVAKKFVPDSFLNNFDLLREDAPIEYYDVDSVFQRYYNRPATERRLSRKSHKNNDKH